MKNHFKYLFLSLVLILAILPVSKNTFFSGLESFADPPPPNPYANEYHTLGILRQEYRNLVDPGRPTELLLEGAAVTAYRDTLKKYNEKRTDENRSAFVVALDQYLTHLRIRSRKIEERLEYYYKKLEILEALLKENPAPVQAVGDTEPPLNRNLANSYRDALVGTNVPRTSGLISDYNTSLDITNKLISDLEKLHDGFLIPPAVAGIFERPNIAFFLNDEQESEESPSSPAVVPINDPSFLLQEDPLLSISLDPSP